MAQASVNLSANIIPDTRALERQSSEALARGLQTGMRQGLNLTSIDKANKGFSSLTAGVRTFDRELDRANRRLLSFGAAGTVVYGTVRAFNALVASTVQVEKSLIAINSIFKLSMRELDSFGKGLFNVARETSQSFADVAKAAEEFSRQGLNAAETAKRTRDAMLLVRLTGLDTMKAVQGLTAAMNTFGKTGIDTTRIVNQLVAADDAFAVSAGGIIEAFARVGSVVDDSGTKLEEFIGLVTALRQVTGRSEATIGNSLKTIFTRLERSSTLEQLRALGIAVDDASGSAKNAFEIFRQLGESYDSLSKEQQQYVSELSAGVFQINQFKAAVAELGKTNGLVAQATAIAANATNEALIRNAELNKSLASSIQNLKTSATQAASTIGELTVAPILGNLANVGSEISQLFSGISTTGTTQAAENFGAYMGESILKGIGNVLGGPGLIIALKGILGLSSRVFVDSLRDFRDFSDRTTNNLQNAFSRFGMGGRRPEEQSLKTVNSLLNQATAAEQRRFQAARSLAEQEAVVLSILERQAAVQARMGVRAVGGRPRAAEGYVPMAEEGAAIARGVGGAPASARPVYLPGFNRGGGQRGIVANTSEWIVPGAAGGAIFNREMIQKFGLPPGSKPVAAGGFIPNAAFGSMIEGTPYGYPYSYPGGGSMPGPFKGSMIPDLRPPQQAMGQGLGQYLDPKIAGNYFSAPSPVKTASGQAFGQYLGSSTSGNYPFGKSPLFMPFGISAIPSPRVAGTASGQAFGQYTAEREAAAVVDKIFNQFAPTLQKSASTLNVNSSIAGLGGVVPYGPQMTPDFRAKLEKSQAAEQARKNRDFERAKKEIEAREKLERDAARLKEEQIAEMNAILDKERSNIKEKAELTKTDLKNAERALAVARKISPEEIERRQRQFEALYRKTQFEKAQVINSLKSAQDSTSVFDPITGRETDESYRNRMRYIRMSPSAYSSAMALGLNEDDPSVIVEKLKKQQAEEDVKKRVKFFNQSDVSQRQIAFQRITGRISEGIEVTPAQQKLVQEVFREQAVKMAKKVLAPGASDAAIRGFVTSYTDAQIEKLNEAGNKALQTAAQRTAIGKELETQRRAERRAASLERRSTGLLMGSTALSFGAAFLPEGRGGTAFGQGMGALGGTMQGTAVGASIGGLFGPKGVIGGAIVGGLIGAVRGFVNKATVSFEELAKDIEETNSAAQRRMDNVQSVLENQRNIGQAIREGRGPDMINTLMRQQRGLMSGIDSGMLQRIVAAGLDEQAQLSLVSQLKGEDIERSIMQSVAPSIVSLTDKATPQRFTDVASAFRSQVSEKDIASFSRNTKRLLPGLSEFTALSYTGGQLREQAEKEFADILSKSKLDETEKKKVADAIKTLKNDQLAGLISSIVSGGSQERAAGILAQGAVSTANVKRLTAARMMELDQAIRIGAIQSAGQNRLISQREQGALGLGGLSEGGMQSLSATLRMSEATRTATESNSLALLTARRGAFAATENLGRSGIVSSIEQASSAADFRRLAGTFADDATQEKLNDIANTLEETTAQNETLIQLAEDQNRIDGLMLQAAQQQRLLSAGTFSGDTGSTARNLFSRLATSTGAARGASAIRMSEFLNQIGLPETRESFQFERDVRSQSVRENIASVLSQRVGYRVRPEDMNIRMAAGQLGGQYGDEALRSRIEEGLKALNFSPEQARQSLLSPERLERSAAASGVLVLKSPLDAIKVATEGTTKILEELRALEAQRIDIQERVKTEIKLSEIESKINALRGGDDVQSAEAEKRAAKLYEESTRLTAQRDVLTSRINNPAAYRTPATTATGAAVPTPGGGGAVVQTPMGPAIMMSPMVVGGGVNAGGPAPQGTPSLLGTFKTGFGTGLESAVRGPFDTVEEALKNLSDVGARVAQSLESSLGNAFGDFVTGAQRGSDAFRSFVVSVLNDASRAFASKAVQGLLGMALQFLPSLFGAPAAAPATASSPFTGGSSFLSGATVFAGPTGGNAAGGYIKRAMGGVIPAEVMKGEFIYGPAAAKRIGTPALNALNSGTFQKRAMGGALVTGGSGYKDDVKMGLPEGSYVIRKAMVERYGAPFLSRMAAGGAAVSITSGAMDVPMAPTSVSINSAPAASMSMALPGAFSGRGFSMGGSTSSSTATPVTVAPAGVSGGGVNISTSISITDQRTSATTNVEGDGGLADKQLAATMARQMEQIALRTIENQTRVGGMLRIQSLRGST